MQDLDIRGAGNLLGGEQSGFIADIGFETYQRILAEAVQELREEELTGIFSEKSSPERTDRSWGGTYVSDCQIETDLEIMFPDEYVTNISERIRLYKELNEISEEEQLKLFERNLIDRFGPLPGPAAELFEVVRLRRCAMRLAIERIILKNNLFICHFISDPSSPFYTGKLFMSVITYVSRHPGKISVKHTDTRFTITVKAISNIRSASETLTRILEFHSASAN